MTEPMTDQPVPTNPYMPLPEPGPPGPCLDCVADATLRRRGTASELEHPVTYQIGRNRFCRHHAHHRLRVLSAIQPGDTTNPSPTGNST